MKLNNLRETILDRKDMDSFIANNGVLVSVIEAPEVRTVMVGMEVSIGGKTEPVELKGISHAVEHMVFKDGKNFTEDEMNDMLDICGCEQNAWTSDMKTFYHINGNRDFLPIYIQILCERLANASITEEQWQKEKEVIQEEIVIYENDVKHISLTSIANAMNVGGYLSVAGTSSQIDKMTHECLQNFLKEYYVGHNMRLIIAGAKESIEEIKSMLADSSAFNDIKKSSKTLPDKGIIPEDYILNKEQGKSKLLTADISHGPIETPDENSPSMIILSTDYFKSVKDITERLNLKHDVAIYADIISEYLTGGMSGILFKTLRDAGLIYNCGSSVDEDYSISRSTDFDFGIAINSSNGKTDQCIEATLNVFEKIREEGISEHGLKKTINAILFHESKVMDTSSDYVYKALGNFTVLSADLHIEKFKEFFDIEGLNSMIKDLLSIENFMICKTSY